MMARMMPYLWSCRTAMLIGPGMPLGIVLSAVYRIGEHLVAFIDVLEFEGRARRMIVIRMVPPGQPAKSGVHFGDVSRRSDLDHRVIIESRTKRWRHKTSLFYRSGA